MKILAALFLGVLLVGCASSPTATRTVLPSGARGWSISCANAKSLNACYEAAGAVCYYGYDIINNETQSGHTSSAIGLTGANPLGVTGAAGSKSTWQRGLLVTCKNDSLIQAQETARYHRRKEVDSKDLKLGLGVTAAAVSIIVIGVLAR